MASERLLFYFGSFGELIFLGAGFRDSNNAIGISVSLL